MEPHTGKKKKSCFRLQKPEAEPVDRSNETIKLHSQETVPDVNQSKNIHEHKGAPKPGQ